MNSSEALRVVAVLAAGHNVEIADETAVLWANDLLGHDVPDALEACTISRTTQKFLDWATYMAFVRDCRRQRLGEAEQPMLGEGDGPSMQEWVQANPEWRERVEAFTKKATGRREEKSSELPVDRYSKLRREAAMLDKPGSKRPIKRSECKNHAFLTHDRCFWCGTPQEVNA
jgi:hypothetical protein